MAAARRPGHRKRKAATRVLPAPERPTPSSPPPARRCVTCSYSEEMPKQQTILACCRWPEVIYKSAASGWCGEWVERTDA